ncbi:hypothetical protein CapIbe_021540 [Capra ibex]
MNDVKELLSSSVCPWGLSQGTAPRQEQRPSSVRGEVKGRSESRRTLQQSVCHPCRAAGDRLVFSASVRG